MGYRPTCHVVRLGRENSVRLSGQETELDMELRKYLEILRRAYISTRNLHSEAPIFINVIAMYLSIACSAREKANLAI